DVAGAPHVLVINRALATKFWPNGDALGKRISFSNNPPNWYQIVGVVGNVRHRGLDIAENPELYVPIYQPLFSDWNMPPMYVVVRSAGEPQSLAGLMRNEVTAIDPDQPIA